MVRHHAKVDERKGYDNKANEDASEGMERECYRPASYEPIAKKKRKSNSMGYRFLEIGTRSH